MPEREPAGCGIYLNHVHFEDEESHTEHNLDACHFYQVIQ